MDASGSEQSLPVRKRRWLQYSLRSLLLLSTLCAIFCSRLAVKIEHGKRQKAAVAALMAKGITISYDYEVDRDGKRIVNATSNVPKWLRSWLGDDCFAVAVKADVGFTLTSAGYEGFQCFSDTTDEDLRPLAELPHVKFLRLTGAQVSDSALAQFQCLSELERLDMCDTKISDAALVHLKAFPMLRELDLRGTAVTDNGMGRLLCLKHLEELALSHTNVTDRGLAVLQELKSLKRFYFVTHGQSSLSDEAIAKLKRALPQCEVVL